jgi:hypothetical protein
MTNHIRTLLKCQAAYACKWASERTRGTLSSSFHKAVADCCLLSCKPAPSCTTCTILHHQASHIARTSKANITNDAHSGSRTVGFTCQGMRECCMLT